MLMHVFISKTTWHMKSVVLKLLLPSKKGNQSAACCSSWQVISLLWTDLNDSDTGVRVPSPLSTTRKKLSWSPSRYTRKVTCLLGRDFSHISSLPASRQSAISLTESSVTVTAGNEKKQNAGHTNQYQTGACTLPGMVMSNFFPFDLKTNAQWHIRRIRKLQQFQLALNCCSPVLQ